jgi:hypothetical protein
MKRIKSLSGRILKKFLLLALLFVISDGINSCKHLTEINNYSYLPNGSSVIKWVDWNILFKPGTDSLSRTNYMNYLASYVDSFLTAYNSNFHKSYTAYPKFYFCPCDTLLYNFTALSIGGSGLPATPPKPTGPGGSGDIVDLQTTNNSYLVDSATELDRKVDTAQVVLIPSSIDKNHILAVMDTGLDSTLFADKFAGLLWKNISKPTIRNFVFYSNGLPLDYYKDDDPHKHGTAVTSIALKAIENYDLKNHVLPTVMVLKALDSNRRGSTFSVSCALKYAYQNHATLINASLGYYSTGEVDSILKRYVDLCSRSEPHPIPIVAAAGNTAGPHYTPLCQTTPNENELVSGSRLFYPGCFSKTNTNVITVTGLQNKTESCTYQNFSDTFVTIGVVTNESRPDCCAFDALGIYYEGSSFATPFVSGKLMGCLLHPIVGIAQQSCLETISSLPTPRPPAVVTVNGRYIPYTSP